MAAARTPDRLAEVGAHPSPMSALGRRQRPHFRQWVLYLLLIVGVFLALGPLVWAVFGSFKFLKELMESRDLLPNTWTLDAYQYVMSVSGVWTSFRNTVIVSVSVTVVSVLTSTMAGYVFAKYQFPGKSLLFVVLLTTLMVPFAVVLVPLYITISHVGLSDSLAGVIVTGFFSTFGIFMMRQFMLTLPLELLEAARIDGASEWRIFSQIVIPLSASPAAALGIFIFLGSWNDYLWPFVVLTSPNNQTLPLFLSGLQGLFITRYDYLIAAGVLSSIPLMLAYAFGSKYMIRGVAMTGLKF
ncbi:MAG: binding-protein-dependent transport system inner rane component [Chloroflexi bacterium]|nr:binding-protein-dependent transport system inner rane component [Chloroflexota bacterium]